MLNAFAPQLLRNVLLMMRSRVGCKPLICVEIICVKVIKDRRTKRRCYWFYHRAQQRTVHSFAPSLTWMDVTWPSGIINHSSSKNVIRLCGNFSVRLRCTTIVQRFCQLPANLNERYEQC